MSYFWVGHQVSIALFVAVLVAISVSNLWAWRRLGLYPMLRDLPRISVLIPLRDEEDNVGPCVQSLLAQGYPGLEVLLLDDGSNDQTERVLQELAATDSRVRALRGEPLPSGWLGKNWSCHQLSLAAKSDFLLFLDADTRYQPEAISRAVSALLIEGVDLISVFPRQELGSMAERLIVPMLSWSLSSFFPLALAYRLPIAGLAASNGQFMLFRRRAYELVGGHASVRLSVVEDVALTRRLRAMGLEWRLLDGSGHVRCRMYRSLRQVVAGLGKNLFALFDYSVLVFLFVWLWLFLVFWEPALVLLFGCLTARVTIVHMAPAAVAVVLSLFSWGLAHWRFHAPMYLTLLYPLSILLSVAVAIRSMLLTLLGYTAWKGRPLPRRRGGML